MRIGEKEGRATFQSFQSLLGWSFIPEGRIGTSWRTLRSSITDGLEMLLSGTIGRPDILWSMNKLPRSVTKWTQACDRQSARLISYIHHTSAYRQNCHVGNTAQLRRLGLFQDSDFGGDLLDSKWTSGGVLCIFRIRTFVLFSWMCKKQTSVSYGSTESEIISSDAGLRMDGLLALDLWRVVIEALCSTNNTHQACGNRCETGVNHKTRPK